MLEEGLRQGADISELLEQAALALSQGNMNQAEELYERALRGFVEDAKKDSAEMALCLQNLGDIYYNAGRLQEAIPLYERLLALGKRVLGEGHPEVLATAFRLAMTYDAVQMTDQADNIYKWVTNSAERTLGIAHPFSQKIREAYFAFIGNRAPSEEGDFRFGLTPPSAPSDDRQYEGLNAEIGLESDENALRGRALKRPSSYKRPTKIKHLRYGADSAEERVSTKVGIRNVWYHWRMGAVAVAFLILFLVITFLSLSRAVVDYKVVHSNKAAEQLIKLGSFRSADGVTGINFDEHGFALLANDIHHTKIPYVLLRGGLDDFKAMWASAFTRRELWYRFDDDQLISESGNVLYPKEAPELFIAAKMLALQQFAQRYYVKTGCYPNDARKWVAEEDLNYICPFTGRIDSPQSKTLNGTLDMDYLFPDFKTGSSSNPNAPYDYLREGGHWRDEHTPERGKIDTLALFLAQRCADGFKVTDFYIRGYDRNARPIMAGKPGNVYIVGLRSGKVLSDDSDDHLKDTEEASVRTPDRICVATSEAADLGALHQGMGIILIAASIACVLGWVFFESRYRIAEPRRFPQAYELGFAVSFCLWLIVTIIHAWP